MPGLSIGRATGQAIALRWCGLQAEPPTTADDQIEGEELATLKEARVVITVTEIRRNRVTLNIVGPHDVQVLRIELEDHSQEGGTPCWPGRS